MLQCSIKRVVPCLPHVLDNQPSKGMFVSFQCYLISLSSLRYDWTFKMLGVCCSAVHFLCVVCFVFVLVQKVVELKTYLAFVCAGMQFRFWWQKASLAFESIWNRKLAIERKRNKNLPHQIVGSIFMIVKPFIRKSKLKSRPCTNTLIVQYWLQNAKLIQFILCEFIFEKKIESEKTFSIAIYIGNICVSKTRLYTVNWLRLFYFAHWTSLHIGCMKWPSICLHSWK